MTVKKDLPNMVNDGSPLKNKPIRQAGQSDADMVRSPEWEIALYISIGSFVGLFAIYVWGTWIVHTPPNPWVWTALALIVIPLCYFKIKGLIAKRKNYDLGRQGEIEVGNILEEFRKEGWAIFHDVQCESEAKKFNVGHVIVSLRGIFAVETKTPRKRLLGNNRVFFDGQGTIKISGRASDRETVPNAISKASHLANVGFLVVENYLLPHLQTELPHVKANDMETIIQQKPAKLVETLKLLSLRKTFKGKCPICNEW